MVHELDILANGLGLVQALTTPLEHREGIADSVTEGFKI